MENLELYTALSGIRIQVLAQALACKSDFARGLHQDLAFHLKWLCKHIHQQIAIASRFPADDDICGIAEEFAPTEVQIDLIDSLCIDNATNEYLINEGCRHSLDDAAPFRSPVTDEETEGLSRFIEELGQLGITVTADFVFVAEVERLAA